MKLKIQTNRMNSDNVHYALSLGGFSLSWEAEEDGLISVEVGGGDLHYLPGTLRELEKSEVPFWVTGSSNYTK